MITTDSHPDGRRRTDPIAIHTYTLPLVRELAPQPANAAGDLTW